MVRDAATDKCREWSGVGIVADGAVRVSVRVAAVESCRVRRQYAAELDAVSTWPVPPDSMGVITEPGGRKFRAQAMPLSILLQTAFGVNPNQIVVPEWAQGVKFDIAATTGSDVSLTYEQMGIEAGAGAEDAGGASLG